MKIDILLSVCRTHPFKISSENLVPNQNVIQALIIYSVYCFIYRNGEEMFELQFIQATNQIGLWLVSIFATINLL